MGFDTVALQVCLQALLLVEVHSQRAPFVSFRGEVLPNHAYVDLTEVGTLTINSVQCHTDLDSCCTYEDDHHGEWYFPSGFIVPLDVNILFYPRPDIYVNNTVQSVYLQRRNDVLSPSGIYRCDISTNAVHNYADTQRETVYVGLYASGGYIRIPNRPTFTVDSDLNGDSPQFTLTCISTGGPATTVTWTRDYYDTVYTVTEGTETVLDDPETVQYTHTLTVTGRLGGLYTCAVANEPSSDFEYFDVYVAEAPTDLEAIQKGPRSVHVSWTPPDPLGDTSGYIISYVDTALSDGYGDVNLDGGYLDNDLLNNLNNGGRYNISIHSKSQHFFSLKKSVFLILVTPSGQPSVRVYDATATSLSLSWSVPSGSVVDSYELKWISDECPDYVDEGSETVIDPNYIIEDLYDGTHYLITVTATNVAGTSASGMPRAPTRERAPSAPPTSVKVYIISATVITVQWGPMDCIDRNGDITGYSVSYEEVERGSTETMSVSGDFSGGMVTITGLFILTRYTIRAAAETSAGTGDYSDSVAFETPGYMFLSLNGSVIPDHGYVLISNIGSTDNRALTCHTNRQEDVGVWYTPRGTSISGHEEPGLRTRRDHMVVRLLTNAATGNPNEGIYNCSTDDGYSVYIGLYYNEGGHITLSGDMDFTEDSDLNGDSPQFTLTCISTGGPATTVTWTKDYDAVTKGIKTLLGNGITAQYTHSLTVTGKKGGRYTCTVDNVVSGADSNVLIVEAPSPPSGVRAAQNGPGSVQVSWRAASGPVIKYVIYYRQQMEIDAPATEATITGLIVGATYSIRMVAKSRTLPSNVTSPLYATIEPAPISLTSSSSSITAGDAVTLTCSITLPSGVTGTPDFEWEGPGVTPIPSQPSTSRQTVSTNLRLRGIATSQAGVYNCIATLGGSNSTSATITVQIPVPTPSITVGTDERTGGTSLTLTCDYNLSPSVDIRVGHEVVWSVGDGAVTTVSHYGPTFVFSPLTTSDGGIYTCTLNITALQTPHVTVQRPVESGEEVIIVQIPQPDVEITLNRTAPLYAGTVLVLTCTVVLDPSVNNGESVEAQWSGPQPTPGDRFSFTHAMKGSDHRFTSSLTISPLDQGDSGTYTCDVRVEGGTNFVRPATASDDVTITVLDLPAPRVTISGVTDKIAGRTLTLTCTVTVVDYLTVIPTVWWIGGSLGLEDGVQDSDTGHTGVDSRRQLIFSPLHTSHGAEYRCQAVVNIPSINVTKNNNDSKTVTVQIPRPVVMVSDTDMELVSGSSLSLPCAINRPIYVDTPATLLSSWTAPNTDTVNAVNESSVVLMISSVVTADSGDYSCSATLTDSSDSLYVVDSEQATEIVSITVSLNVTISADYTAAPGEDPDDLGPNEFTAGSVLSLICEVQGHSGDLTYDWTVTRNPDTPRCIDCDISSTTSTLRLAQPALSSYHAGIHTCTVSESGRHGSRNSDDFTVAVVGAGIYSSRGAPGFEDRPIANNGLIVSASDGLSLYCVSSSDLGIITDITEATLTNANTGVWRLTNSHTRPGVLYLQTKNDTSITTTEQGIYTCNISSSNGEEFIINVGLYPNGFTDPPNITELVYYDYADSLECVSTSSPPTIVSWMKDGIALIIDNSTNYNLTQTITNRTSSTYSNVLTVSEGVPGGMAGTYTCTITNDLGSASSMVVATDVFFQIHLSGEVAMDCSPEAVDEMENNITEAILDFLNTSCPECSITSDIIDMSSLTCHPEEPTYVTYRARLEGTSETDSGSLISLLEEWVRGGATIMVTGIPMTADSDCPVALSSLNDEYCSTPSHPKPNMLVIIGGGSAAAIVIAVITVAIICIIKRRFCGGHMYFNRSGKYGDDTGYTERKYAPMTHGGIEEDYYDDIISISTFAVVVKDGAAKKAAGGEEPYYSYPDKTNLKNMKEKPPSTPAKTDEPPHDSIKSPDMKESKNMKAKPPSTLDEPPHDSIKSPDMKASNVVKDDATEKAAGEEVYYSYPDKTRLKKSTRTKPFGKKKKTLCSSADVPDIKASNGVTDGAAEKAAVEEEAYYSYPDKANLKCTKPKPLRKKKKALCSSVNVPNMNMSESTNLSVITNGAAEKAAGKEEVYYSYPDKTNLKCPKAKPPSGPVKKDGAVCGTAVAQDMKASNVVKDGTTKKAAGKEEVYYSHPDKTNLKPEVAQVPSHTKKKSGPEEESLYSYIDIPIRKISKNALAKLLGQEITTNTNEAYDLSLKEGSRGEKEDTYDDIVVDLSPKQDDEKAKKAVCQKPSLAPRPKHLLVRPPLPLPVAPPKIGVVPATISPEPKHVSSPTVGVVSNATPPQPKHISHQPLPAAPPTVGVTPVTITPRPKHPQCQPHPPLVVTPTVGVAPEEALYEVI